MLMLIICGNGEVKLFPTGTLFAVEIKHSHLDDLTSSAAKKIGPKLNCLGYPSLPKFSDEFIQFCDKLGIR